MPDKEEEVPEHITKYHKLSKKKDHILFSRQKAHSEAYNAGIDAIIEEGKELNPDDLEKADNQKKVVDAMVKHYIKKAKEYLHVKEDHKFENKEDEKLYNDQLLSTYSGLTEDMLRRTLKRTVERNGGKSFTHDNYIELTKKHTEDLGNNLTESAAGHLEDEHIESIVKYTKAEDLVDVGKMKVGHAVYLLDLFKEGKGAVTKERLKGMDYAKKEEKKEDAKK